MDFSDIYGQYAKDVHRFALYLSGSPSLAEDLTSQTFVNAMCGRTDLDLGTVKAYLFAITRNLYRDAVRHQRRIVDGDDLPERQDPRPGPDINTQDKQRLDEVLRAIQRLPEPQREALVMATDQDMSYEEIARVLGCSVAAIKVRIHRARLALREELERKDQTCK